MTNLKKFSQIIEKVTNRLALGYESTCDFVHGYCYALMQNDIISRKEYNALMKVHGYSQDDGWFINYSGNLDWESVD